MTNDPNARSESGVEGIDLDSDRRPEQHHDPDDPDSQTEKLAGDAEPADGQAERKTST